jgi:hypothetical protein
MLSEDDEHAKQQQHAQKLVDLSDNALAAAAGGTFSQLFNKPQPAAPARTSAAEEYEDSFPLEGWEGGRVTEARACDISSLSRHAQLGEPELRSVAVAGRAAAPAAEEGALVLAYVAEESGDCEVLKGQVKGLTQALATALKQQHKSIDAMRELDASQEVSVEALKRQVCARRR